MDDSVVKSMARWPNVPAAFGWLELDARGAWRIKGERIGNAGLVEFINRNYEHDDQGRWYFQNGPQRVYIRLQVAPYVVRTDAHNTAIHLRTHTHRPIDTVDSVWLDDTGRLIVGFDDTAGVMDDRDLTVVLTRFGDAHGPFARESDLDAALLAAMNGDVENLRLHLESGRLNVGWLPSTRLATKFGFEPDPRPAPGQPEC